MGQSFGCEGRPSFNGGGGEGDLQGCSRCRVGTPPPSSRVRGGMLLIVPVLWVGQAEPPAVCVWGGGGLEGLGMGSQIQWGGVL